MKQADKIKLLFVIGISLIFTWIGCVDTGVQNIDQSFDFQSQLKIVNLASITSIQSVTVLNADGSVAGTTYQIPFGQEGPAEGQPFLALPAGSKRIVVQYAGGRPSDTLNVAVDTEYKTRLYIINPDSQTTDYLKSNLRYIWQERGSQDGTGLFYPDSAYVGFLNLVMETVITDIDVSGGNVDTTIHFAEGLETEGVGTLMLPAPGDYNVTVHYDEVNTTTAFTINATGSSRYTSVIYADNQGNPTGKVFTDD